MSKSCPSDMMSSDSFTSFRIFLRFSSRLFIEETINAPSHFGLILTLSLISEAIVNPSMVIRATNLIKSLDSRISLSFCRTLSVNVPLNGMVPLDDATFSIPNKPFKSFTLFNNGGGGGLGGITLF